MGIRKKSGAVLRRMNTWPIAVQFNFSHNASEHGFDQYATTPMSFCPICGFILHKQSSVCASSPPVCVSLVSFLFLLSLWSGCVCVYLCIGVCACVCLCVLLQRFEPYKGDKNLPASLEPSSSEAEELPTSLRFVKLLFFFFLSPVLLFMHSFCFLFTLNVPLMQTFQ